MFNALNGYVSETALNEANLTYASNLLAWVLVAR